MQGLVSPYEQIRPETLFRRSLIIREVSEPLDK